MLLKIGESLQPELFNDRTYREARLVEAIKVRSDYTGQIEEEAATGRFHARLAFTRQAFEHVGGWPLTMRGDFDQQLIVRLDSVGIAGDPCEFATSAHNFHWGSTGVYHEQGIMQGSDDEEWYHRSKRAIRE